MDKVRRDEQDAWERADDVKRKIHHLSLGKRFYVRAAEIKMKRNRATIAAARLRNRQLRCALNDLREKERCALGFNDLARMQKRVAALEKYHNHLLHLSKVQQKLVLERQTDAEMAKIDCEDVLDQNTPPLRKHRSLASAVKASRLELQRAHAKDLSCQQKLKPMLDERTVFDAQVDTMARSVAKKHQEFEELMCMYHDATRTRESARGQLQQLLKRSFEVGGRYHNLFVKPSSTSSKRMIAQIDKAIANITMQFRAKSMKEVFMALVEEERKHIYMNYFKDELQDMVNHLKHGYTSAKSYHEKVIKLKRRVCKPAEHKSKVSDIIKEDERSTNVDEVVDKAKKSSSLVKEVGVKHKLCKMIKGTQKLIEKIQEGRLYNGENEHLKRILIQLEQKLVQILQGLQVWMESRKSEKAQEHYARLHRTSIMIKENYEQKHEPSPDDDNLSSSSIH